MPPLKHPEFRSPAGYRILWPAFLFATSLFFLAGCFAKPRTSKEQLPMSANPSDLVASIDAKILVERLLPGWTPGESDLSSVGVTYHLDRKEPGRTIHLSLAAVENPAEAKRLFDHITLMTSTGPRVSDQSLGDGVRIWGATDKMGGPLIYRRGNVFMEASEGLSLDDLLAFARKFDEGLRVGAPWCKTAATLSMPNAELIDPPAKLDPGEVVKIRLKVSPMAPDEVLLAGGSTHALVQGGANPILTYYAPRQAGADTISLLIATRGNLFAERNFTLSIR
jgi:hypothetical protein